MCEAGHQFRECEGFPFREQVPFFFFQTFFEAMNYYEGPL